MEVPIINFFNSAGFLFISLLPLVTEVYSVLLRLLLCSADGLDYIDIQSLRRLRQ